MVKGPGGRRRGAQALHALAVVHRWLGLTLGCVLMSSGLSGMLLVVANPGDPFAQPAIQRGATTFHASAMDEALRRIRAEFPRAPLVVRLPRASGQSAEVALQGAWNGEILLDPSSGAELARQGSRERFFDVLFEWHSALLAGTSGKAVLFAAALAGIALAATGVALWWPRGARSLRSAFSIGWRANEARLVLDLHRVTGVLLAPLIVLSIASGAYMAWRPISAWVDALAGHSRSPVPEIGWVNGAAPAPLSRLVAAADAALPGGRPTIVVFDGRADAPVRVRLRLADEVHPNGLSSAWLHPQTAEVLRVVRWNDAGAGALGFQYLYPLHVGALGGTAHRLAVAACGMALFLLGAAGAWLWWRRGRRIA
jgi:uncharacterized iron-regulated membrane protein